MVGPLAVLRGSRLAVGSKTRSGQSIAVADGRIVALGDDDDLTEHGRAAGRSTSMAGWSCPAWSTPIPISRISPRWPPAAST
jgi:hypothetical protein